MAGWMIGLDYLFIPSLAALFTGIASHALVPGVPVWMFTTTAVVLAQTFVALPFLVVSLEGALRTAGGRYEAVAATLGAAPGYAFRHVTVPLVLPGLASGAVLAFALGIALGVAGSLPAVMALAILGTLAAAALVTAVAAGAARVSGVPGPPSPPISAGACTSFA